MSTTEPKLKTHEPRDINKLSYGQTNPNYTLRVICCVLFIFLTEICLSHYIYRLISSEIREDYVQKRDIEQYILNNLRSGNSRDELTRILKEISSSSNAENSSVREKRSVNILDDDDVLNLPRDEAVVDFFHPNRRSELQAKDEIERQKTGKGTAPGGDNWVWLTNYCRVTMASIQGYCSDVKKYCPPSAPGPKGPIGPKGERGDTGYPGIPGPPGPRGHPGHTGEKGTQGRPGLDGRDGVPGEPGFDGMPGRNGHDGIPGIDGLPGLGGKDGKNGTNGRPGLTGPTGPLGPQGPTGLTGPRGRSGKPGNHGTPGIPGINAWKTKVNGSTDLLIPPSIAGNHLNQPLGPAVITERDNVTLHCAASGVPKPHVEWIRADGQPITMGAWQAVAISGHTINITMISRVHMGTYVCIADNGVPPQVNQTFILEIHFIPLIRIRRDMIGAANRTTAMLECEVESFPEAVRYWERSDGALLVNNGKYEVNNTISRNGYTVRMQLNITQMGIKDFTRYYCVAKNEKGTTRGSFSVYEVDPSLATPPPVYDTRIIEIGQKPPKRTSQESICPPSVQCPECLDPKEFKCRESGVSLIDLIGKWEIRQFSNNTFPGYPDRTTDCVLYAVGKPVFNRFTNQTNGCWMRDPLERDGEKFYATNEENDRELLEYENKEKFKLNEPSKKHGLTYKFKGNAHVVYNGSFYYNAKDKQQIIKLNLVNDSSSRIEVPLVATEGANYLYTTGHNYMDFSIDDNGLWVIFGIPDTNNTAVMKVDTESLQIQYIWNISLNHHKVGEMFVVCGVLYAVDSVTDRESKIRFALDLYKNTLLDVNLPFTNPFRNTTMVGYNHKHKELYTWDRGNQLTYPVRYHEIGYKHKDDVEPPEKPESAMHTGLEIFHSADNLPEI